MRHSRKVAAMVATGLASLIAASAASAGPVPIGPGGPGGVFPQATASMATGVGQTCMIDSTVRCLGGDWAGQLGPAASGDSYSFLPVTGVADAVRGAAGWNHTCALRRTGEVLCWGANDKFQLGGDYPSGRTPQSVNLPGGTGTATYIAAGWDHTCAITTPDAMVACWGDNIAGEVGDFVGTSSRPVWVRLTGSGGGVHMSGATQLALGRHHSCALMTDLTINCWGLSDHGQLGDPAVNTGRLAEVVKNIDLASRIGAGDNHTCAVMARGGAIGTVKCWGENSSGQLGDGTTTDSAIPVTVNGPTNVAAVSGGTTHTCAVKSLIPPGGDPAVGTGTGTPVTADVWCWGGNDYGQLGDGTNNPSRTPVKVIGLPSDVSQISAGSYFTCAMSLSTGMWCWGQNHSAQLGDGTHNSSNIPVHVVGSMPRVAPLPAPYVVGDVALSYRQANRWWVKVGSTFTNASDPRGATQLMTVQVSTDADRPSDTLPPPAVASYANGVVGWSASGVVSRQSIKPPKWVRVGNRGGKWSRWVGISAGGGAG